MATFIAILVCSVPLRSISVLLDPAFQMLHGRLPLYWFSRGYTVRFVFSAVSVFVTSLMLKVCGKEFFLLWDRSLFFWIFASIVTFLINLFFSSLGEDWDEGTCVAEEVTPDAFLRKVSWPVFALVLCGLTIFLREQLVS